jgi:hypothetical protein
MPRAFFAHSCCTTTSEYLGVTVLPPWYADGMTVSEDPTTTTAGGSEVTLTQLAQSLESLRPVDAPPGWAEITGPLHRPRQMRWHSDLDTLIGFVAPNDCQAIGVVGSGWARNLAVAAADATPLLAPGERRRCRVVFLMTRSGDLAGYLRAGSDLLIDQPPTVGRVPDLICRALGLPTPPPEESTGGFLAYIWLVNVLGVAGRSPTPLTWTAVIHLHPAMQVAAGAGIISSDDIVASLRVASDAWSWSFLTQEASESGWMRDPLPPGAAGWMDEGILSRWLLNSLGEIEPLVDRVTRLVAPTAAETLRATLRHLGVIPAGSDNPRR